jgi:hypothetical protein
MVSASAKSMPTNCSTTPSLTMFWHQLSGPSMMTLRTPSSLAWQGARARAQAQARAGRGRGGAARGAFPTFS